MLEVGIELGASCMPSGHASDRATAPGPCSEIAPISKDLFNSSLDTGVSRPKSFGETVLCPIHKSGPTNDPNNFRNCISKYNVQYIF